MQLSDDQINAFRASWKADFGEDLAPEEARLEAMRLLDFFAELIEASAIPPAVIEEVEDGEATTK